MPFVNPALLQQYASRNIYAEARQGNKAQEDAFEDAAQQKSPCTAYNKALARLQGREKSGETKKIYSGSDWTYTD